MDKMTSFTGVLLGTVVAALAGCASTGGDIGGLLPAPKFLKGSIDNNLYTSKGNTFTVAVPHPQGSYEYKYMHVKEEEYPQGETYTSFGPAAFDQSIYRLTVTFRATPGVITPSVADISGKILETEEQKAEAAYGSKPSVVGSDTTPVDGRPTFHWQLKQEVAAGKLVNDQSVTLTHDIYVMDLGYAMVTAWVQVESFNPSDQAKDMTPLQFASSVTLLPPVNDATRRVAADGTYTLPKQPVTAVSPAALCGIQGLTEFDSGGSVDFVAPDWLWQLSGDYAVQVFQTPKTVVDRQSFVDAVKQLYAGYIPNDRKPLGLDLKLTNTKEMDVGGLPAVQGIGVDEGKAVLVVTAVLQKSRVTLTSGLYPIPKGSPPNTAIPWDCYGKFVNAVKERD